MGFGHLCAQMHSVMRWLAISLLLCLVVMADERKAFLANIRKTIEKPKQHEVKQEKITKGVQAKPPAGISERKCWLAQLKKTKSGSDSAAGSQLVASAKTTASGSTSLVADFSIRSLESFWSRAALTAGEGSGAAVRKRPHYDNRLRRLNAKHFVRRSHLGVEPDSTSWK